MSGQVAQHPGEMLRVATADWASESSLERLARVLRDVRQVFEMDVAFVSEFKDGRRVFRHVDAAANAAHLVRPGASDALENSYCQRVIDGRLPAAIPDAQKNAEACKLAATTAIGVGAHLSVPLKRPDGTVYGTLCCFSRRAHPWLTEQDADTLRDLAGLITATMPELFS